MAIRYFSYNDEFVLDPFGGSFTTAIVAKKLGRIGIGIELNKKMFRDCVITNIRKNFTKDLFFEKELIISEIDYE